ncbi:Uncharacterised protein [Mycobacteroides abscessus subsp. abscessus]|nr:Uncharacterised protein [Mycobacteroides abscessus subsp. abscessus]
MVDVVEELVREAERILHAHGVADAADEALGPPLNGTSELTVERLGGIDVLGGADPERERGHGGLRALPEDEVVVDELLHRPEVDGVLVLPRDLEVEDVDVEVPGLLQVGDDEFHVRAAHDIGRGDGGGGDRFGHDGVPLTASRRRGCGPRRG